MDIFRVVNSDWRKCCNLNQFAFPITDFALEAWFRSMHKTCSLKCLGPSLEENKTVFLT